MRACSSLPLSLLLLLSVVAVFAHADEESDTSTNVFHAQFPPLGTELREVTRFLRTSAKRNDDTDGEEKMFAPILGAHALKMTRNEVRAVEKASSLSKKSGKLTRLGSIKAKQLEDQVVKSVENMKYYYAQVLNVEYSKLLREGVKPDQARKVIEINNGAKDTDVLVGMYTQRYNEKWGKKLKRLNAFVQRRED